MRHSHLLFLTLTLSSAGVTLAVGRDLTIESAQENHAETHYQKTKESGVFSNGGLSVTVGKREMKRERHGERHGVGVNCNNRRTPPASISRQMSAQITNPIQKELGVNLK